MAGTFIQGLSDLLASGENLPTLPQVVFEVHRALDNELSSAAQIAEIIEKDPALTTRLLRMANSAYFGGGRERVGSVMGAINRMGMGQVRATCLVLAVVKSFSAGGKGLNHSRFWSHSAYAGMLAQQLWKLSGRGASGEVYQNIYVCGLLHDVGLLVLDQFFPDEFAAAIAESRNTGKELWVIEDETLGMDHGEIGGLLLGRWALPDTVTEAVAKHHRPSQVGDEAREMCAVVHASEIIATGSPLAGGVEGTPEVEVVDALEAVGFEPGQTEEVIAELKELEQEASGFAGIAA